MGYKLSTIIVQKPAPVSHELLLQELGFTNVRQVKEAAFEMAMYPTDGNIYIGTCNNNLLICADNLPRQLIETDNSEIERTLTKLFPESEICALVLHSVVNWWAYTVIVNGQKIRARAGCADEGTFLDKGEPLKQELELLSQSKLDDEGNRVYFLDSFPDEPLSEDQVGENLVFAFWSRYFEAELDSADESLFKMELDGYSCGKVAVLGDRSWTTKPARDSTKPWWKLW